MRRRIEIGLIAGLIALGITVFILTRQSDKLEEAFAPAPAKEISIRNATKGIIHYTIKLIHSYQEPEEKALEPASIHRYQSKGIMTVNFERPGLKVTRQLIPGTPYSFRYDENNLLQLYEGSHGRDDAVDLAPYVATPMDIVEKMLEMARVDQNDVVYDIGCGDGRIVITAAKKFGARGVGIDIVPQRIKESLSNARNEGVRKLAKFRLADATKVDISEATVVTLYLLPESNELLRPKLERELKPGVYVISHNYRIPGWEKKEVDTLTVADYTGKDHTLFLYQR